MAGLIDKLKYYFRFTPTEIRGIVITTLIVGFIWGFNDGAKEFVLSDYLRNMILAMLLAASAILIKETTHKLVGLSAGYRVEFQMWWYGQLLALAICVVSRGWVPIVISGGIMIHSIAAHRLGYFRYGLNMLDVGLISMMGPIGNIIFATVIKNIDIYIISLGPIADQIFRFNLLFAVLNLLPIPPLVGSKFFYTSRLGYFFVFGFIALYVLFIFVFDMYSWMIGLAGAILAWALFYFFVETKIKG